MARCRLILLVAGAASVGVAHGALAQATARRDTCDGRVIKAIIINPGRPPFAGSMHKWQVFARTFGLHHATTRTDVIRSYLLFNEGEVCSQMRLSESVRMLRTLPFLADAAASAHPDSASGTWIEVRTIDEVPVYATGALRHWVPSAVGLGNENIGGLGLGLIVAGERSDVYRGAARVQLTQYALLHQPVVAAFQAQRDALGGHIEAAVTHPFLSELQQGAWQVGFRDGNDYPIILTPTGDDETVEVRDQRWSVSGAWRASLGPTVVIGGPLALGTHQTPAGQVIAVTDSGTVTIRDTALLARFQPFRAVRVGGLLGARRARYVTRIGLDALFAPQDVMTGWQLGGLAAMGGTSDTHGDVLVGTSAYYGLANSHLVIVGDLEAEASHDVATSAWRSAVVNLRSSVYITPPNPRYLVQILDNVSTINATILPVQLSLADADGGPRGYAGSTIAGGRRNLTRIEGRWSVPAAVHHADVGFAAFVDAATMWRGDVPFGTSLSRQSVGVSLLAAYPSRSKRLYRIDFAMPIEPNRGAGLEIRFSNREPTIAVLTEPSDVTQARLGPTPSSLFAWPPR